MYAFNLVVSCFTFCMPNDRSNANLRPEPDFLKNNPVTENCKKKSD